MRLTEALAVDPTDEDVREALLLHLDGLREQAAQLQFETLASALGEALHGLEETDFSPSAVIDVRTLAWRFEVLAARPEGSGTHRIPASPPSTPDRSTLGSLVEEVTGELRRGLLTSATTPPEAPLEPGREEELLTPLWKAIGEIRGVIERRSGGAIRFEEAPGIPLLTLSGIPSPEASHSAVALKGRRILVADDDAEVRWLYVGMLREAGATVVEASDGIQALELAREEEPDLILADIVMPKLDGLGLCAAVRREPVLDGVPVVLLSWREDLLHRMRELRAGARDYLRKELPAQQILDRVDQALRPLAELEASLTSGTGTEVRGDVEDLGVAVLLRAVRRVRPNVRIAIQDPWVLFEIELRDGRLAYVSRTAINGEISEGESVLTALAGMRSGRFAVGAPMVRDASLGGREDQGDEGDADGALSLDAVFEAANRRLGRLLSALADSATGPVELDTRVLATYTRHSPPRIQRIVARLAEGTPPREIWESGEGSRALVDALLVTLARQGGVVAVGDADPSVAADAPRVPDSDPTTPMPQTPTKAAIVTEVSATDPFDRENTRAQSGVAMHREPSNPMPRATGTIWRFADPEPVVEKHPSIGEFDWQSRVAPRVLAWGFAGALVATFGVLLYRIDLRQRAESDAGAEVAAGASIVEVESPSAQGSTALGDARLDLPIDDVSRLAEHAGELRAGIDPELVASETEGVLELQGSSEIAVEVDGVFRGALPLALVVEQGRHRVRYRVGDRWVDRFGYVPAGATRVLRAEFGPGGFVDAR